MTYLEAARCLAECTLEHVGHQADARVLVHDLFRRVLIRPPADDEAAMLVASYDRWQQEFAANPRAAEQVLAVGEYVSRSSRSNSQRAALAALAAQLLNTDESLTKE